MLPRFSSAQLGLASPALNPVALMESSQVIKTPTGLCRLWLVCDLAMAPCPYLEVTNILCFTSRFELISVE